MRTNGAEVTTRIANEFTDRYGIESQDSQCFSGNQKELSHCSEHSCATGEGVEMPRCAKMAETSGLRRCRVTAGSAPSGSRHLLAGL